MNANDPAASPRAGGAPIVDLPPMRRPARPDRVVLAQSGRGSKVGIGCAMSDRASQSEVEGPARFRVLRAVSRSPARCLQLCLLSRRRPPRRRGLDRADLPAGLPSLRACPARVTWATAAPMADPYR